MSVFKKYKKNIQVLTKKELDTLEKELYDIEKKCREIISKGSTKENMNELLKYGKRLKHIKKILKNANKKVSE